MTAADAVGTFADLARYAALSRITALTLSPDGSRLVATVSQPDDKGAKYVSSLWEVDPRGQRDPVRLTWSQKGESGAAFAADGALLFISSRPAPGGDGDDESAALWELPATGEARVIARSPGGIGGAVSARSAATVIVTGSRLVASADATDDAARRKDRKDRKLSAILHTGMPIRYWDHEVGEESPRLLVRDDEGSDLRDLAPDAGFALHNSSYSLSADGRTAAASWTERRPAGRSASDVVVIDVASGDRRVLVSEPDVETFHPVLAPDATRVAVARESEPDYATPFDLSLVIHPLDGAAAVAVELGDLWPTEWVWSPDSATLFVTGDWHGRGAVLAVDPDTGCVLRRLTSDASYSLLQPAPDGALYAIRAPVDAAPHPVRLDSAAVDQTAFALPSPAATPAVPGTLTEVETTVDGATVRGWLCLPSAADGPAPVQLWVHGGPFGSWNAWSWRWNPWIAVAHGYAVLLPDPALSTGYGYAGINRAWPHRAAVVWREVEALLDAALTREDLDAGRTACLGGSFGGYMTNWIAGHTDRFGAIVTHAGLWALDQQHKTTDAADFKTHIFGTPAEHPDWYAENSPNNFVDLINTPMLIVHGNRDYRVPISEALRLWWDLVSHFDGDPAELPHRFLQLTGENHWVLSPGNAEIWYSVILGFLDQHVRGGTPLDASLVSGKADS
ncbi:MAG: prolyl oligopeptidase family serine peptidase [Jatrophihabitans sp.]